MAVPEQLIHDAAAALYAVESPDRTAIWPGDFPARAEALLTAVWPQIEADLTVARVAQRDADAAGLDEVASGREGSGLADHAAWTAAAAHVRSTPAVDPGQ